MKRYDIFCKIVDNFGDIGVCWRLARQLHAEHSITITLWLDDLSVAKQLIPTLNTHQASQRIDGITICHWHADSQFNQAAEVVIEAFGCELPEQYLALMQPQSIWINLEYLSAENWVADFHGGNSKRGELTRHFFFPGFNANTGGLIREHHIAKSHQQLAKSANDGVKVSLFCYPNAPISDLLHAMATGTQAIQCYVPATSVLPKVATFFSQENVQAGDVLTHQNLTVTILPFLSQADYDDLLASCDINFVRGEDSWIRAIWAAKPFIWQPYWQTEDSHIIKLNAFLDVFYADCDHSAKNTSTALHYAWSSATLPEQIWQDYLSNINTITDFTLAQCSQLAALPDLASNLVIFIEKLRTNKI
ncbi:MAG: hypothetical protein B7Y16_02630 [Methylotenera sp. 24-45-7]|nr:MAG: hypothetical protein B7Y72_05645 [Mehylophilales bacterium 35-46-6]OYZ41302.1 MAG: hypothetical protein B7Y16_02630 [Methylotenera sp. 24-45-7]OZA09212.1 MAG: hypothetical protein B7X97_03490 [Methylotenera sp. 17-45-7]OZA51807.1 MAG: hypothetical protein B7X73_06430 [Methylophilales bacterium 39-45-7]HQS36991.1 elongation factor P maturation arginine rhamnosyltransferase EarP [Methylotenera sp.]